MDPHFPAKMELLKPSYPPIHGPSPESLSGFSSPASFRLGFDRTSPTQLPEIVEDDGNKVHVAVGKSVEKAMSLLNWTFTHFEGKEVCILHVYQPSQLIPTHCKSLSWPKWVFGFSENLVEFLVLCALFDRYA